MLPKMSTSVIAVACLLLAPSVAFAPNSQSRFGYRTLPTIPYSTTFDSDVSTKPTAISFFPAETLERAEKGSPIEKMKLERDVTNAWVDVYEFARKIREGEMTWEEVEKAGKSSNRIRNLLTTSL